MRATRLIVGVLMIAGGSWLLREYASDWMIPAIAIGVILGLLISWLFVIKPAKRRLQLLHDGKHEEFHLYNDAQIKRTRNRWRRGILRLNRATAFFQAGDLEGGVAAMDELGPGDFRGTTASLYWLNLTMMLCYADPGRAAQIWESQSEELDPKRNPRIAPHLEELGQVYRLMVEDCLDDEAVFRDRMATTKGIRQAFAHYHVARIHALRGETADARAVHAAGQELWPSLILPPPTGPATGASGRDAAPE